MTNNFDVKDIKKDFPIFNRKINGNPLVYLDNSATSQIPRQVMEAISEFEYKHRANVHRGVHTLSEEATTIYEEARKTVAEFIKATVPQEVIFVRNTTEAINLIAFSLGEKIVGENDVILLTEAEHHSNLIPWQKLAERKKAKIEFISIFADGPNEGEIDWESVKNVNWSRVKIVSFTHISNVIGTINDVKDIVKKISKLVDKNGGKKTFFVLDSAQSVPHISVDVKSLGIDFMCFSGHKMCGPMGIGVLWAKREILNELEPYLTGGGMIAKVEFYNSTFAQPPEKYEAGTPNVSGAVGLAEACRYLDKIGLHNIHQHENNLIKYAYENLSKIEGMKIYGTKDLNKRSSLISFNLSGIPANDLSAILDTHGVAIRSGYHCVMPWHKKYKIPTTARASFYLYNDYNDIDTLIKGINSAVKILI